MASGRCIRGALLMEDVPFVVYIVLIVYIVPWDGQCQLS